MSTELKAVLVNETTGEIEYLPQEYCDIVDTSLGAVSHEVEVVTVDDFRRRMRNSTSTTQTIVKPLVTPLPSGHPVRNTPTLLRNSRTLQRQSATQLIHNVHNNVQNVATIQNVSGLENVSRIEFLPVQTQFNIGASPSVLPPASAQFLRQIDTSNEAPQLIVYNCGDNQFDIIDQDNVQLRLCEVVEDGDDNDQNTIYICEQEEPTYVPDEEYTDIQVVEEDLPTTMLQDEDGNVYEVEELQEHLFQEYTLPVPAKRRKGKVGTGRSESLPVKVSKRPLNELKCMESECSFSGVNIAELRKHLSVTHNFAFDEEVINFNSEKEFKLWRETYERERMVSFIFRGGTKKVSRDQAVTYLICHRSGHYKPTMKDQSLRKRKMKPQGSCKMNGYCTAGIKLCKSLESGMIRCEICHTHYGHPLDNGAIPHLRVNNVLRKIILKKFEEGMSFNQVVQYLHHNPDRLEGLRLLDRRAVRNIYDKYRKNPDKCFLDELDSDDPPHSMEDIPMSPGTLEKDSLVKEPGSVTQVKIEPEEAHVVTIHIQTVDGSSDVSGDTKSQEPEVSYLMENPESVSAQLETIREVSSLKKRRIQRKPKPHQKYQLKSGQEPLEKEESSVLSTDTTSVATGVVATKSISEVVLTPLESNTAEAVSELTIVARKDEEEKAVQPAESEPKEPLVSTTPVESITSTPARRRGRKPKAKSEPIAVEISPEPETSSASSIRRSTRERKPKLFADDDQPTRFRQKSESKAENKTDVKSEAFPESTLESKPDSKSSKTQAQSDTKSEPKVVPKLDPKTKSNSNLESKAQPKIEDRQEKSESNTYLKVDLLGPSVQPTKPCQDSEAKLVSPEKGSKKKPESPAKSLKRKTSNDPPTLEKVSPLPKIIKVESQAVPPILTNASVSLKGKQSTNQPTGAVAEPEAVAQITTVESLQAVVKPSTNKPTPKGETDRKPKRADSHHPFSEIISEELQATIANLLKHGESGPTILMYKRPGTVVPEFGRKDPRIHKDDFILVIQTPVQRQLMQMFSDVVSIDGHKGRPRDLKLMWVIVLDEFREAIPVAWLITNSAEDRVISTFLRVLHAHTGDMNTSFVQAPNGSDYCHIWSTVFKCNPGLILNEEETRREMRIEVAENFADNASRRALNSLINSMMTAVHPKEFDDAAEGMKSYLQTEHDQKGATFWKAFHDNWISRSGDWDLVHRINAPVNTIHASNAFGKLKKFIAFKGTKILNSCIDPVLKIGYDRCFSRSKRIFKGDQKLLKVMEDMEIQHCWASEMSPDNFEIVADFTFVVRDESKNCSYTVFDVQSPCRCKFVCPKCEMCLHRFICNCPMSSDERAMCSHVHFARMMSLSLVVPLHHDSGVKSALRDNDTTTVEVTSEETGNTVTIIVKESMEGMVTDGTTVEITGTDDTAVDERVEEIVSNDPS